MLANGNQSEPKKVKGMRKLAYKNRNENNEQDTIDKIRKSTIRSFEKINQSLSRKNLKKIKYYED